MYVYIDSISMHSICVSVYIYMNINSFNSHNSPVSLALSFSFKNEETNDSNNE